MKKNIYLTLIAFAIWFVPATGYMANFTSYKLLEPLPNETGGLEREITAENYFSYIFQFALSIASVLAVIRLIYAGIIYMSTDAYAGKSEAKKIISDALWGLGLALSAWVIVATIIPPSSAGVFQYSLSLDKPNISTSAPDLSGGGAGGGPTGCRGECPYSHTWGNEVVKYKDCNSCSKADSFEIPIKYGIVDGKQTMVNTDLGNKLKATKNTSGSPGFRVTESWPPTSNHANQKQYDGTSVDIALNTPTNSSIVNFIRNAEANGLKVTYEVKTQTEKTNYVNGGVPENKIIVVPRITAEHFSVE